MKERRTRLKSLLGNSGVLLSQSLPGTLRQLMAAGKQHGLEGIVAMPLDSKYQASRRSNLWLKHPMKPRQEFVIGAFRQDGKKLELLLVGYFKNGKLAFAGKVHQGLNPVNRAALFKILQPLRNDKCILANLPTMRKSHWGEGVTAAEMNDYIWLRPQVVAEIGFAEWTTGGVLRQAEFLGLREDKLPEEVRRS